MAYKVDGKVTAHFSIDEMCNPSCSEAVKLVLSPEAIEHAQMMEELRTWYNKPMTVNCWYRSKTWNAKVGGNAKSGHLYARATDIKLASLTDAQFKNFAKKWAEICKKHGKIGEIGRYSWGIHFGSAAELYGMTKFYTFDKR